LNGRKVDQVKWDGRKVDQVESDAIMVDRVNLGNLSTSFVAKEPDFTMGIHDIEDSIDRDDRWNVMHHQNFNLSWVCFSFFSLFVCFFSHVERVSWKSHYFSMYNNILCDFTFITYKSWTSIMMEWVPSHQQVDFLHCP
jgi:hypothetical protein